ncbi:hypothetical protein NLU13_1139 [Sarocladium strictum]|uniref:Peptide hydrolase n=1 Tax=Sarocladium strictum TaxID=5046 RepID=A0AA39LC32_SARSR|nr:hypothetical protein NLU13_1139 [Sarocladium strictum]
MLALLPSLILGFASTAVAIASLSDDDLRNIPSPGEDFDIHNGKLLAPILIPRVPGTEGNFKTQRHFVDFFSDNLPDWELIWQNSTSTTPATGNDNVPFSNIVFRRDPPWAKTGDVSRLTLVAHFDSKLTPKGFIGATDSAAPCAMLMHVARSIDSALTARWKQMQDEGKVDDMLETAEGVQILLLDGEEAFVRWTDTDSLYGARSLAEEWENQFHPSMSTFQNPLQSISLFVLLDLLGSKDPVVPSYFLTTHWAYRHMATIEKRMRDLSLLETKPTKPFLPDTDKDPRRFGRGSIEDDHIPFMRRGVDVLHMIPSPFPAVWHTMDDDGEHLDLATTRDWAKIVTAFAVEWMDVKDHMPKRVVKRAEESGTEGYSSMRTEL